MNSPPSFLRLCEIVDTAILMPRRKKEVTFPGAVILLIVAVIAFVLGIYGLSIEVGPHVNTTYINTTKQSMNISVQENKSLTQNKTTSTPTSALNNIHS